MDLCCVVFSGKPPFASYVKKPHRYEAHACPNGCMCFVGPHNDAVNCMKCHAMRYLPNSHVPSRRLHYFPLIPRIVEMVRSARYQSALTCERDHTDSSSLILDVQDGTAARQLQASMREDSRQHQTRNRSASCLELLLAVSYDGTQVHNKMKKTSDYWPLMVTVLNLPPNLRNRLGIGTFVVGLVAGLSGSAAETDLFESMFLQELQLLHNGITIGGLQTQTTPSTSRIQLPCSVFARLALHIYDTKAWQKVLRVHGPGSRAGCVMCRGIHGQHRSVLNKVVHLGHR